MTSSAVAGARSRSISPAVSVSSACADLTTACGTANAIGRAGACSGPAQSVASLFPRAFVGETEMDALNRFFWNQFDAPAIAYYLIAAIVLVAVISGIHTLVPA